MLSNKNFIGPYILKCILVGDRRVGKSALFVRYFTGNFPEFPTYGVDFQIKIIEKGNQIIKYQFWDLSPMTRTQMIKYYESISALILVYDISDRSSFLKITNLQEDYIKFGNKQTIIVLVGNKIDLEQNREVSFQEGNEFASSLGAYFFEASALSGQQVQNMYEQLIDKSIELAKLNYK